MADGGLGDVRDDRGGAGAGRAQRRPPQPRRGLRRWPDIAYGALLNFSLMATYGGELSIERFLTLEARAVPFDAAHVAGNVASRCSPGRRWCGC